ncbi:MAG: outer membrane beta-barrel protein [Pseudomonadales bacterium]
MKSKGYIIAAAGYVAAALLWPALSLAAQPSSELNYDFVDLGVTFGDIDTAGDDVDFSTFDVNGSWGVHKNIALIGRVGVGEIDTSGDIDTTELAFGINAHFPLTDRIDLVVPVAIEWAEYEAGSFEDDDTGFSLGFGVRALASPAWEFNGGLRYIDIFGEDDLGVVGGARWHISSLFSLSADATIGDDASGVRLGGRFSF